MTCQELQDAYELSAFGTLEQEERSDVEAELGKHLARGCSTCTAGMARARELALHLAAAAPGAEPSADLKRRILASIAPSVHAASGPRSLFWRRAFGASALAAAVLLAFTLWLRQANESLHAEIRNMMAASRAQRQREHELQRRLGAYRDAVRLLSDPEAREVRFGPRQPSGRVVLQPRGLVLIASDFPPPPKGRTYELWLIAANVPAPIPAGVFDPDPAGNALLVRRQEINVAAVKAIAVSDEPPGGVPAPTGKILFSAPVK